jgi:hypothetical protein
MLKDYFVVDNFFSDPQRILKKFEDVEYYSNEKNKLDRIKIFKDRADCPEGFWRGFRSKPIHKIDKELFHELSTGIALKAFQCENFSWFASTYFHLSPDTIDNEPSWWHVDDHKFAGVIYMNEDSDRNTGTTLVVNNTLVNLENVFNRLVFYKANIQHRPTKLFGKTFKDVRKTITIFYSSRNVS